MSLDKQEKKKMIKNIRKEQDFFSSKNRRCGLEKKAKYGGSGVVVMMRADWYYSLKPKYNKANEKRNARPREVLTHKMH